MQEKIDFLENTIANQQSTYGLEYYPWMSLTSASDAEEGCV